MDAPPEVVDRFLRHEWSAQERAALITFEAWIDGRLNETDPLTLDLARQLLATRE
jgi:hypothetical protein